MERRLSWLSLERRYHRLFHLLFFRMLPLRSTHGHRGSRSFQDSRDWCLFGEIPATVQCDPQNNEHSDGPMGMTWCNFDRHCCFWGGNLHLNQAFTAGLWIATLNELFLGPGTRTTRQWHTKSAERIPDSGHASSPKCPRKKRDNEPKQQTPWAIDKGTPLTKCRARRSVFLCAWLGLVVAWDASCDFFYSCRDGPLIGAVIVPFLVLRPLEICKHRGSQKTFSPAICCQGLVLKLWCWQSRTRAVCGGSAARGPAHDACRVLMSCHDNICGKSLSSVPRDFKFIFIPAHWKNTSLIVAAL